jgi:ABC-type antimicrobial peptide transport system permease subunit
MRNVTIPPGESTEFDLSVPRRPPGTYTVTARSAGGAQESATYTVRGDERLGAALATSGQYTGGSGITRAIQVVLGNIEALVVAIVSLLAIMTMGSTTAAFTRTVYTSKAEIGIRRATGATPTDILQAIFYDAFKIGLVASVLSMLFGFSIIRILLSRGSLRVFGLSLDPVLSPTIVVGAIGSGVIVAVVSALLAAVGIIRLSPAALLVNRHIPVSGERDE